MTPVERQIELAKMMGICTHLAFIKVTDDEPHRIRIADIREDLRADFEQHQLAAACPGDGYAYAHDFYRWSHRFNRLLSMLQVPLVSEQPSITLRTWNLVRYPGESKWILIGWDWHTDTQRRSSYIEEFDLQNMRLLTASGRLYFLVGKPTREHFNERWVGCPTIRELGGETWV